MAFQKQTAPSFAVIASVLSIVFYCVGFIRLEIELHEQKNRINALENVAIKAELPSNPPNDAILTEVLKNAPGESEQFRKVNFNVLTIMTCLAGSVRVRQISDELSVRVFSVLSVCCNKYEVRRSSLTEKKIIIRMKMLLTIPFAH